MGEKCFDFEVFKKNEHVVLATTKHGGHLGYHESLFKLEMWIINPCIAFFNALR